MVGYKDKTELEFEREVIDYLTKIGGRKQWVYEEHIKTTEQLWANFKKILERNNSNVIKEPLTEGEFIQVKNTISSLRTPYEAGKFLYGVNGNSQIEVNLDNGELVILTVFDQDEVGGGRTTYQIVNQIERKRVVDGKKDRRFDVTLLINGLPLVQIELKKATNSATTSLNQMEQYISEKQYGDIYSTLQILVAMTPHDIRYMSNTTKDSFNRAFAFNWQLEKDAAPVRNWKTFADLVLSIPMAHDLATRYMILDGTPTKESIKVMRPYQVYATKRVLDKVRKHDFSYGEGRLGYIWHTTGSGKTITSFKTAWLTGRLPNVDKVIFLVDRIALTSQTARAYRAYDPAASEGRTGIVGDTANINELHRKLTKKSDKNIIVTSIQKMSRYVERENFKPLNEKIVFIVDEAHRSTGDGKDEGSMLETIRKKIPTSAWIGYTGTPRFPVTREVFGELLHAYTIKEAIADKNVLGFKVEFKETIPAPENPTEDDIDDNIKSSIYDTDPRHVEKVVEDIYKNWRKRSVDGKYNALFTVHVGGNKKSTPRAMEYFDKFIEENEKRPENERLKVAISFSEDTSNKNGQLENNNNLHRAIKVYNKMFNTAFDMKDVKAYVDDLSTRLNRTALDGKYLDLAIVVDQLLTGFDAPQMNTLYIDRTLKGGNLIQAYSRTNRMYDYMTKPYGNVVNYRWPVQNEYEMNKAFSLYSNRSSADEQLELDLDSLKDDNEKDGIIAKGFEEVQSELREVVENLRELTDNFLIAPHSEQKKEETYLEIRNYTRLLNQLKQYTTDSSGNEVSAYDDKENFYDIVGITEEQEVILTTIIAEEIKEYLAEREFIDISQIDLELVHIHDIKINYDYLIDLVAKMADEIHENKMDEAKETKVHIDREIAKSEDEEDKKQWSNFVDKIYTKQYEFDNYPAPKTEVEMRGAMEKARKRQINSLLLEFIGKWGLTNTNIKELEKALIYFKGNQEVDKKGVFNGIVNEAKHTYSEDSSSEEISAYKWITYRREIKNAFKELAEKVRKGE